MESKTKKFIALSPAKLAANRANALKSTGPRTPDGKRRSAGNARVTHGFRAHEPKLSASDQAEIEELEMRLSEQWHVTTPESAVLVRIIAAATWRREKILTAIDDGLNNPDTHPLPSAALERYLAAAEAVRSRARKALEEILHA